MLDLTVTSLFVVLHSVSLGLTRTLAGQIFDTLADDPCDDHLDFICRFLNFF